MTVNSTGGIVGYDDYYPYGMQMSGRSYVSSADQRYKFTGKERDFSETGWDYFGARYYDSRIGKWLQVDPLAGKYPSLSPYNYAANNPMFFVDPSGDSLQIIGNEKYRQMALNAIQNGLPKEVRSAVKLVEVDGKYFVDDRALNDIKSDSPEFLALRQVVNSNALGQFEVVDKSSGFTALNRISGSEVELSFGSGLIGGASGITLTTGIINSIYDSPASNAKYDLISNIRGTNQVFVNGSMSQENLVKFTAHELYGHLRPYFLGERYSHNRLGDSFDKMVGQIQARALQNFRGAQ